MTCTTWPTALAFSGIPSPGLDFTCELAAGGLPRSTPGTAGPACTMGLLSLLSIIRSAYDFDDFRGDGCLPHFVHGHRERFDDFAGVFGGGFHGGHPGGVFGGRRFQHGSEDLGFDVSREQLAEQMLRGLFVDVVDFGAVLLARFFLIFFVLGARIVFCTKRLDRKSTR